MRIVKIIKNRLNAYVMLFKNLKGTNIRILDSEDTLKYSIKEEKSIIRFGDGEFAFLYGNGIEYQKYNEEIKKELQEIIDTYTNESKYILCVPQYFFKCNGLKLLKKIKYVLAWSKPRDYFNKYFKKNVIYGDAFLFSKGKERYYKNFFESMNEKKIIFIHRSKEYAELFEKKYNKKVIFIKVPSKNSYEVIDDIELSIENKVKENKNDFVILVSAGPMAKVLVKRICLKGMWGIDTGHCWDKPLHNEGD